MICILGSLELPVLCLVFMAHPFPYLVPHTPLAGFGAQPWPAKEAFVSKKLLSAS